MSYDLLKQVFCHQLARESSGAKAVIAEFLDLSADHYLVRICEQRPTETGDAQECEAPLSPSQTGSSV